MSFGLHTPESLLERADSRSAATTCKGLTANGRLCRRGLANGSLTAMQSASPRDGVVAILDARNAAAYFCWQHKDQAESLIVQLHQRSNVTPLKPKSSIDTLMERVGVLNIQNGEKAHLTDTMSSRPRLVNDDSRQRLRTRETLSQDRQHIHSPLMSVAEDVRRPTESSGCIANNKPRPVQQLAKRSNKSRHRATLLCCTLSDDDTRLPAPRKKHHKPTSLRGRQSSHSALAKDFDGNPIRRKPVAAPHMQQTDSWVQVDQTSPRPPAQPTGAASPPDSNSVQLLSLIPTHLSPVTISALLNELSKPLSEADEEGYIYIFWLTPESDESKPDDETASSLVDDDEDIYTSKSGSRQLHTADGRGKVSLETTTRALYRYSSIKRTPATAGKIMLKIGRASNVHRRLSQWTKQCGQNITLIRYYPYRSRSSSPGPMEKKTCPYVHRVEKLIHLELADKRVSKEECTNCGRVHKEWFEVNATKQGVSEVDEVVRRWVAWAENLTPGSTYY